jgi:hypothetical protein
MARGSRERQAGRQELDELQQQVALIHRARPARILHQVERAGFLRRALAMIFKAFGSRERDVRLDVENDLTRIDMRVHCALRECIRHAQSSVRLEILL